VEHWYDVLLDGPRRDEQIEGLNQLLRNMGELGIGVMGYNFNYANVWGTIRVAEARGGATSPGCRTDLAPSAMADQLWRDMAQQRIWQLRPPETEDAKREFFGKSHSPRP
jgi:D-mannonate dehydratase